MDILFFSLQLLSWLHTFACNFLYTVCCIDIIIIRSYFVAHSVYKFNSNLFCVNAGLAPSAVQALLRSDEGEKKPEPVGISLDSAVTDTQEKTAPKRKTPSKDAPLRWAALVLYLAVTVPILLAVIVMIALP